MTTVEKLMCLVMIFLLIPHTCNNKILEKVMIGTSIFIIILMLVISIFG